MIMLSPKSKINYEQYDHIWYATTSAPGKNLDCEHHPEIAGSYEIGKYCIPSHPEYNPEKFYEEYWKEITSEPKISYIKDIVRRSEAGEWFQLIFYEQDPTEGERPYMYKLLKSLTDNVYIE